MARHRLYVANSWSGATNSNIEQQKLITLEVKSARHIQYPVRAYSDVILTYFHAQSVGRRLD